MSSLDVHPQRRLELTWDETGAGDVLHDYPGAAVVEKLQGSDEGRGRGDDAEGFREEYLLGVPEYL